MPGQKGVIKVLIIDDEEPARDLIKHYIEGISGLEIAGECSDGFSGLKAIRDIKPDLVLLDVQMPKLTGFELLELIDDPPAIIFSTAYDEYAIRAFEMNAVDYLLKPYPRERFEDAIIKASLRIREGNKGKDELQKLKEYPTEDAPALSRIVIRKGNSISFIPVQSIICIEAEDDYVLIRHAEGKALKQQTMKYYEAKLPADEFARIHRSAIARINMIKKIEPYGKDTYIALLKDGTRLPVSRNGYKTLKEKADTGK